MKKTIFVTDISSIKHNHFSFKNNGDVILEKPFKIKKAPDGSRYHFDKNDLAIMSRFEKDLAPHDEKDSLSKTAYISKMKKEFYHLIRAGEMDTILSNLYGIEKDSIELKWDGPINHEFKIWNCI